jgi:predicted MFS family arabinose efflux permease
VFGLVAGAVADRVDRRALVMVADGARAVVVGVLCLVIATGRVQIAVVLAALFLLGIAEVFADTTSGTLLPMLLEPADLGIGNARLNTSFLVSNQLVGPPLGAFLFAAGMVVPFAVQVAGVALSIVLLLKVATPGTVAGEAERRQLRREIGEGLRWLLRHPAVRTLALVILVFNITWGAAWSVLVLYSLDRLHLGAVGFGLLTTSAAVGGILGTSSYGWLERHVSAARVMRGCLLLEVLTHLSLALTTVGWLAMVIMFVFGGYAFVWGTVSQVVRQRAVPGELQGRVGSVHTVGLFGGLVIGQVLGGPIADHWGLTGPFWFAFAGSGVTLALVWRQLGHLAAAEPAA